MKKLIAVFIMFLLINCVPAGCGEKSGTSEMDEKQKQVENKTEDIGSKSLILEEIKKATIDAGYNVTDEYQAAFLEDVTDGFTVQVVADNRDYRFSFLECKTEEAAMKNEKIINDAGRNITIRRKNIISYYGVDIKNGTAKDILASILDGKPVPNK